MKYLIKLVTLSFLSFQTLVIQGQEGLTLRWVLGDCDYEETKVNLDQNSANVPPTKKGEKLYRFFSPNQQHEIFRNQLAERHERLWQIFLKEYKDTEVNQRNFSLFAKSHDPYYCNAMTILAPKLKFDFIGSTKQYALDSIEVHVLRFDEYRGSAGGFYDNEAWYDIHLRHTDTVSKFAVGKKLRFTGSGSATLRFWSDNFYRSVGLTPTGCYTLNIKFHFLVENKKVVVSTGIFKIDV